MAEISRKEKCTWTYETLIEYANSECSDGLDTHRFDIYSFNYCPFCGKEIEVIKYGRD